MPSSRPARPGTQAQLLLQDTHPVSGLLPHTRLFVDDAAQSRSIGEAQWEPNQPCTELGDLHPLFHPTGSFP